MTQKIPVPQGHDSQIEEPPPPSQERDSQAIDQQEGQIWLVPISLERT
jgi:hypothetical protein